MRRKKCNTKERKGKGRTENEKKEGKVKGIKKMKEGKIKEGNEKEKRNYFP